MTERISRLDRYLAATMRPAGSLRSKLEAAGLTPADLQEVVTEAKEAGFSNPGHVTAALLEEIFGHPVEAFPDRLTYTLDLWPSHVFDWRVEAWGAASHDGFRLISEPTLVTWKSPDFDVVVDSLRLGYHTSHEVRQLLGDPDRDESWGSAWQWVYGPGADRRDIVVDLDYGLLRELRVEPTSAS